MKPFLLLIAVGSSSVAWARPVAPVKEVRTVFDAGGRGDAFFNSHLREQMRAMGFRFIPSRSKADAILRSSGQGTRARGFRGFASLTAPNGKAIWSAGVERAPHSRAMAFDSLAQKLRAARR
jgi:hypothetical protein